MATLTVTVSVADVYRDFIECKVSPAMKEEMIKKEIKLRFIQAGISFYDRLGLYPIPPCKVTTLTEPDGLKIITIKQDQCDQVFSWQTLKNCQAR